MVHLTNHGRDRVRQRVCKAVQETAEKAFYLGLLPEELPMSLIPFIDGLSVSAVKHGSRVSFRVWYDKVYIFARRALVTVIPLPGSLGVVAIRATKNQLREVGL